MGITIDDTLLHILLLTRHLERGNVPAAALAILIELGFSPQSDGFGYLRKAIYLKYRNPDLRFSLIYLMAGQLTDPVTGPRQVEEAIRGAISSAWKRHDEEEWSYFFPAGKGRGDKCPANGDFIARMACILELWNCCSKEVVYEER